MTDWQRRWQIRLLVIAAKRSDSRAEVERIGWEVIAMWDAEDAARRAPS